MTITTKTIPERLYLCVAGEMTQPEIASFAQRAVDPLFDALGTAGLKSAGDLELICPKWNGQEKSRVMFAIPIREEKAVSEPYFIWKSPIFKCACYDHKGSMPSLKAVWSAFGEALERNGFRCASSCGWREVYKYWESFHSDNDLTELRMEIL
jgi:hypothetical protein